METQTNSQKYANQGNKRSIETIMNHQGTNTKPTERWHTRAQHKR